MKISLLALCVLLPAMCMSTPLPQTSAVATSDATAHVTGNGGSANANSNSSASAGTPTPPSSTSTTPSTSQPCSSTPAPGGSSSGASASSSSSASASTGAKCTVPGFTDYTVLTHSQGDIKKLEGIRWFTWKSTVITQEKFNIGTPVCTPRYLCGKCKASAFQFKVTSETDIEYYTWGTGGESILYIKQKLTVIDQSYHVYKSQVETVAEVKSGSQEIVTIQEQDQFKAYFDNSPFAFLASDYQQYIIGVSTGEHNIFFVSVSEAVYLDSNLKQQVWTSVSAVLQENNISESDFFEVTSTFELDYTQYNWEACGSGGASVSTTGTTSVSGSGGSAAAGSSSQASTGTGTSLSTSPSTPSYGNPGSPSAQPPSTSPSPGGPSVQASSSSNASANSGSSPSGSSGQPTSGVSASASASAFAETGNPTDVPGFEKYSVIVKKDEEFIESIKDTTFFVWKITESKQQVTTDVTVCADRYICSSCKATKFEYSIDDKGCVIFKEWGCDASGNLIYIQENISFASQQYIVLKSEVVNVMKATTATTTAVSVQSADQVKSYLSSEYAILGYVEKKFIIGQTSTDKDSVTFIAVIEEIYKDQNKQQEIAQCITEILQKNCIDESTLTIVLSAEFEVDTNKYNMVSQSSQVTSQNGQVTTSQQTTTQGGSGKSSSSTQTSVSGQPPSGAPTGSQASASSSSSASVGTSPSSPPSSPPCGSSTPSTSATPSPGASATGSGSASATGNQVSANTASQASVYSGSP